MAVSDYLLELTGVDPAQGLRVWNEAAGRYIAIYDDLPSAHKVTGFLRDFVKVFEECVNHIPLPRTENPKEGDVGIIHADFSGMALAAIFLGKNWAAQGKSGLIIGPAQKRLASWSVEPWRQKLAP